MIKASTITLYLSQSTIALITPTPTLSAAISRQLAIITAGFAETVTSLSLGNNPNILDCRVVVILDSATHELLLRATLSNPSLTLSAAVDGLLSNALKPIFSTISGDALIVEKIESYPLPYGCLVPQYKNREIYWLWRYPHRSGRRKDMYLGKGLDRALGKVRLIGIPKDAAAKRLNKGKKLWAKTC
jgi:hypothetical protein